MENKLILITHENGILEVQPDEIEVIIGDFYDKTTQPYSKVFFEIKRR